MEIYLFVVIMLLVACEPFLVELEEVIEWVVFHPIKTFNNIRTYLGGYENV